MPNYQRMYTLLFNAITDGLYLLQTGKMQEAEHLLMSAQQSAEEMYIEESQEQPR